MDYNLLTNCDFFFFFTKVLENSYDIEVEQQVRNQGTNHMLDITSAMETNEKCI